MTPDDLDAVESTWAEFFRCRIPMLAALTRRYIALGNSPYVAAEQAHWLFRAVEQLVGLLSAPSRLADRARAVGDTWPDPLTAPSFAVEGRAWMGAASDSLAVWSADVEASWCQAWFLLSEVLAAETLSPFLDDPTMIAAPTAQT
jgi:hypothetical protein